MMENEILPMTKSEAQQLDFLMIGLRTAYREYTESKTKSGSFAFASVLNFDNDVIIVEIKYGVQISIPELVLKENVKINRHTMEVIEKVKA